MPTPQTDLYAILGVPRTATKAEIAHAFRLLARRHHPDTRSLTDPEQTTAADQEFQRVLRAYTLLRNPEQRAHYDRNRTLPDQAARPSNTVDLQSPPTSGITVGPVRWHRTRR